MTYYTYELVDPRDDKVFYVGKGKGSRRFAHFNEARNGKAGRKCNRIRAIWADGAQPMARIVRHYEGEQEAYDAEARLIEQYGLANLTNITIGGIGCILPRDPMRDARRLVVRYATFIRPYLIAYSRGFSATHTFRDGSKFDFIKQMFLLARDLREKAGHRFFDEVVGVA